MWRRHGSVRSLGACGIDRTPLRFVHRLPGSFFENTSIPQVHSAGMDFLRQAQTRELLGRRAIADFVMCSSCLPENSSSRSRLPSGISRHAATCVHEIFQNRPVLLSPHRTGSPFGENPARQAGSTYFNQSGTIAAGAADHRASNSDSTSVRITSSISLSGTVIVVSDAS